jgi:hypothetical protein
MQEHILDVSSLREEYIRSFALSNTKTGGPYLIFQTDHGY